MPERAKSGWLSVRSMLSGQIACKTGLVMKVVARAISTAMENSAGEMARRAWVAPCPLSSGRNVDSVAGVEFSFLALGEKQEANTDGCTDITGLGGAHCAINGIVSEFGQAE